MTTDTANRFHVRVQECLLQLAEFGALPLIESDPDSEVFRIRFRSAGNSVDIDLDRTVLEIRVYHERDVLTTGRVREEIMDALLGTGAGARQPTRAELAPLRQVVQDWKSRNARMYMRSPDVARHPDGRNNS
jgi:hypothetical protein